MNEILTRWHYCWHLIANSQERKTTVLATLNTLRRLIVGHTVPFGTSFIIMALCIFPSVWGYETFSAQPIEGVLFSWKAWLAALLSALGTAGFELVAYYELLYMRASVERKDSEYITRYFWNSSAFWWYVPLILFCSEVFALILTGPLVVVVKPLFRSAGIYWILKCFFLLWALDFYRAHRWISRAFKSAFRLALIFVPLLIVIAFAEWGIKTGLGALIGFDSEMFAINAISSTPGMILWGMLIGLWGAFQFFLFASLANTLYLRGKHTYSEDFFN